MTSSRLADDFGREGHLRSLIRVPVPARPFRRLIGRPVTGVAGRRPPGECAGASRSPADPAWCRRCPNSRLSSRQRRPAAGGRPPSCGGVVDGPRTWSLACCNGVAEGDEEALRLLWRGERALGFSRSPFRILGREDRAEDVIQELFIRVWRNAASFHSTRAGFHTVAHTRGAEPLRRYDPARGPDRARGRHHGRRALAFLQ